MEIDKISVNNKNELIYWNFIASILLEIKWIQKSW